MTFEEAMQSGAELLWLDTESRRINGNFIPAEHTRRARATSAPLRFQWKRQMQKQLKHAGWQRVFFQASPWPPGPDGFCDVVVRKRYSPGFSEGFIQASARIALELEPQQNGVTS